MIIDSDYMPIANFTCARLPRVVFGAGRVTEVPELLAPFGPKTLLVTGGRSLRSRPQWIQILHGLHRLGIDWCDVRVDGEPSPTLIDDITSTYSTWQPNSVLAIGGGSVLDAGKAIAALLPHTNSVMDYIEGVGRGLAYVGPALPCVAVPTTAGTGSEVTKNAVLSQHGMTGYKKSFRHEALVPQIAVVDPDLSATCPRDMMAAQGMDAFTQLLESYTSSCANPITNALAWDGLEAFRDGFWQALNGEAAGRSRLAYAALLSGMCLAQTGLGVVHGCAAPLGAFFPIPHGVVCTTLIAEATAINIQALEARDPNNHALAKYSQVGTMLKAHNTLAMSNDPVANRNYLIDTLRDWVQQLQIARLGDFGMTSTDISRVVAACTGNSMKTNPIVLNNLELSTLLRRRL